MFTGIIESVGKIKEIESREDSARISVYAELTQNDLKTGDSLAVNGVCLTITSRLGNTVWADIGKETLKVTTLKNLKVGDYVNLERPMQMGGRLGGHLVQGHADGVGIIVKIQQVDNGSEVTIEVPSSLSRYCVKKGSVALNGVSLTIADCSENTFKVFLIPHTIEATTFKHMQVGDPVNLEVDIIGKYVEKLTHLDSSDYHQPSQITEEFLKRHGF